MVCSRCGGKLKVMDSRPDAKKVYRIRECKDCGERFMTVEAYSTDYADLLALNRIHADRMVRSRA